MLLIDRRGRFNETNGCYNFNGTTDAFGNDGELPGLLTGLTTDEITFAFWAYLESAAGGTTRDFITIGDTNGNAYYVIQIIGVDDQLRVIARDAATGEKLRVDSDGTAPAEDQWVHFVVTHGTRPTIYFDGVAQAMDDFTTNDLTWKPENDANLDKF